MIFISMQTDGCAASGPILYPDRAQLFIISPDIGLYHSNEVHMVIQTTIINFQMSVTAEEFLRQKNPKI